MFKDEIERSITVNKVKGRMIDCELAMYGRLSPDIISECIEVNRCINNDNLCAERLKTGEYIIANKYGQACVSITGGTIFSKEIADTIMSLLSVEKEKLP